MKNNYRENYTLNLIEAPILASYRIVLTKAGSLHLNLGPYISYGLSAKLKLSGATETETDKAAEEDNDTGRIENEEKKKEADEDIEDEAA